MNAPYPDPVQRILDRLLPAGVPPPVLFRTVAKSARAWNKFIAGSLLDAGPIDVRQREIVINRTCARAGCDYEWGIHIALLAGAAKLTSAEIKALGNEGPAANCWTPSERALLAAVDALHDSATLGEPEWLALKSHFDDEQILEVLMLCGFYRMVSYLANGLALAIEPYAGPLPRG